MREKFKFIIKDKSLGQYIKRHPEIFAQKPKKTEDEKSTSSSSLTHLLNEQEEYKIKKILVLYSFADKLLLLNTHRQADSFYYFEQSSNIIHSEQSSSLSIAKKIFFALTHEI